MSSLTSNNPLAVLGSAGSLLEALWHQRDGRFTRELLLHPSRFGLGRLPESRQPDAVARSVCGFCSTGCSLDLHLKNGEAIGLSPTTEYPVNLGMACPKGWEALEVLDSPDRGTTPLLRGAGGVLEPTSWDVALSEFARRLQSTQAKFGAESIAFLGTGQMPFEELAFFGSLCKFGLGMIHGDANTRQCMATAHVAYKQSFGFDAPPFTYSDFERSDTLIFVGANPCIAHPILWERVMRNPLDPTIVVIDPRRTETAMQATRHHAIAAKGDLALLYGTARELIHRDWIDRDYIAAHTSGFAEFAQLVEDYDLETAAGRAGVTPEAIVELAEMIHRGRAVTFWWTMGVNQSYQGVRTAQAIINLCLMTGNIGRPGTGPNSITGQCNAMGSRIFGNTTSLLAGRDFTKESDRADVARLLEIPVERVPTRPSLAYPEIIEGIRSGAIRGLWVVATNPAHSWIDQSDFVRLREKLDFLVVQDMYSTTETAQMADLFLPAAAWGEKEGTFINSERRLGSIKKVTRAPGQALSDFAIFRLIAEACGVGDLFREWTDPEAAFRILQRVSAGRPCDITGIDGYAMIDRLGGVQWPLPKGTTEFAAERRLFEDGRFFTPDGKARFLGDPDRPLPEPPDAVYPLILNTGRGSVAQWHTETRTAKSAVLRKLGPSELHLEIHPHDAARYRVANATRVQIESRRGSLECVAVVTETVQPGQLFLPMHDPRVNQLTYPAFDPYSRQPSYKDCAVRIQSSSAASAPAVRTSVVPSTLKVANP